MKKFISAPLPFQGQKRRFIKQLEEMAMQQKKEAVFVDLFGGSGLVSHVIKRVRPECRVVYNDYDHYSERLANVERTNDMRPVCHLIGLLHYWTCPYMVCRGECASLTAAILPEK